MAIEAVPAGLCFAALVCVLGCEDKSAKLDKLKGEVAAALPIGSSRRQVEDWLKDQRIEKQYVAGTVALEMHQWYESKSWLGPRVKHTMLGDSGVRAGQIGGVVRGHLHPFHKQVLSYTDLWMFFILGKDDRLLKVMYDEQVFSP